MGQYSPSAIFEETKKFMKSKVFGDYDYTPLIDSLEGNEGFGKADYFLVGKDFPSYVECQEKVAKAYKDPDVRRSYPLKGNWKKIRVILQSICRGLFIRSLPSVVFHRLLCIRCPLFLSTCGACSQEVFEFQRRATYLGSVRAKLILAPSCMPR